MIHYTLSNTRLLPIEYLEVAYIESTGTLWINTEYIITKNTYFDIKYMRTSLSSNQCVFGYRSVSSPSSVGDMIFFFIYPDERIGVRYGYTAQNSSNSYSGVCNLISDGTSVRLNNELIILNISYSNSYSPKKAYLFTINTDGYADSDIVNFTGRIYHCIILESGILKRHFIPCYRKSDNKPGLFDIVKKKFYINSGSGEFLVGENVNMIEVNNTGAGGYDLTEGRYLTASNGTVFVNVSSSVSGDERSFTINSVLDGSSHGPYLGLYYIPDTAQYTEKIIVKANRAINSVKIGHEHGGIYTVNLTTSYLTFVRTFNGSATNLAFVFYSNNYQAGDVITIKHISLVRGSQPYLPSNTQIINVGQSYGIEGQYDKNIYTESDGSKWIRIFHHNNPANAIFESTDTFTTGVYKDENRWFDVAKCNEVNKWELMIKQKTTSDAVTSTYRFILYINPMSATLWDLVKPGTVKNISGGTLGGIWRMNNNAYLVTANSASTNWFGAIGAWNSHQGGIPGYPNTVITSGFMDLYLRVDNVCPMYKDCYEFNETGYCEIPSGVFKCFDNDVFTISFWIKDEDANRSIYFGNYSAAPNFNIEKKADGNLRYYQVRNDGTKDIALFAIPKSKWTLVTLTVNSGTLKAYKNGTLSSTTSIGTKHSSSYANTIFRIGSDTRSDATRFKGYMLDFRVYDYALTDNEILKLYNMRNV